ncbi:WD40 repeat domain-containing protein [Nonomuraea lactucae]|uniref:WD40 repeat domain-containing protein n=1 Tax=Nonomuraea lactucae TaxID=2249762 RepID=UPI000DE55469|nr:WD40 repeat domain-containing protein [Nonomuraea lactucae]
MDEREEEPQIRFEAHAEDSASINQAAGDLHFYLEDGTRVLRRTIPGQTTDICPYPGLAAFGPDQSEWYCGRDKVLANLLGLLDRRRSGVQMIIAPSGAGKSSLLGAGLLPELKASKLPGSSRWARLWLTPGVHPVAALAAQVAAVTGNPVIPAECADMLQRHLGDTPAVVVVDQFEELFTLCADLGERRQFLELLGRLAERVGWVVIGLRADFYSACLRHPLLLAALQDSPLLLKSMTVEELRDTILYPARREGLIVEPGLVELLLRDLGAGPEGDYEAGRLPLLAHALRASWQQRNGHTLTVAGYLTTGGISGAIATTADRTLAGLSPAGQAMTPRLLVQLVKLGDTGTPDVRRARTRGELVDSSHDPATAREVIDAFTDARLLTSDRETVTITHDELLRSWPRLRDWITANREDQLIEQALGEAATAWHRTSDADVLYRGALLDQARAWARRAVSPLTAPVAEFLEASDRLQRRTTRRRNVIIGTLTVLSLVATTAAVFALQQRNDALAQRDLAVYNRVVTESDRLRATDLSKSAQLALVAHRLRPSPATAQRVLGTQLFALSIPLRGHTDKVTSVAYSPDGRTVASSSWDSTIRLWDVSDPANPAPLGPPITDGQKQVNTVVFSNDGRLMASADWDRVFRLWDVSNPSRPVLLSQTDNGGKPEDDSAVALSPDGKIMAGTGLGSAIDLWDVSDPRRPVKMSSRLVSTDSTTANGMEFSPDGRTLFSTRQFGESQMWDLTDLRHPKSLDEEIDTEAAAFSPDGRHLATSGLRGMVALYEVKSRAKPELAGFALTGHTNTLGDISFSPDGLLMATASQDQTVRLWNMADPQRPTQVGPPLTGHTHDIDTVRFSPDGRRLVTASDDYVVRLWSLPRSELIGHSSTVRSAVFSRDGTKVATTSDDQSVRFWDVSDPAELRPLGVQVPAHRGLFKTESAWSPDGRLLATFADFSRVRLWNVSDFSAPRTLGDPLPNGGEAVLSPVFRPDGAVLAVGNPDGGVRLWDVTTPSAPRLLGATTRRGFPAFAVAFSRSGRLLAIGHGDGKVVLWDVSEPGSPRRLAEGTSGYQQESVEFSPDGRVLASVNSNEAIQLWDVSDPRVMKPLSRLRGAHNDAVNMVAFSPDGKTMASGSQDSTIRIWNVTDPKSPTPLGEPFIGHSADVRSVAFSPDGKTMASGSRDNTVTIWSMDTGAVMDRICLLSAASMTREDWRQHVGPDIPYDPPCARRPTAAPAAPPSRAFDLSGVWQGTYHCAQGETSMRLTVGAQAADGFVSARLDLGPTAANKRVPRGAFTVHGRVAGGELRLLPGHWIEQPYGYVMVGLTASLRDSRPTRLTGRMLHPFCTSFSITRA